MLIQRIQKNHKHLQKWARRTGCNAFRIYDRDIPEFPYAVDCYDNYFVIYGYARPNSILDPDTVISQLSECFSMPKENFFYKVRARQSGLAQYEKSSDSNKETVVEEFGLKFLVNLSDYLDTGLFLDHRLTRKLVGTSCANARFLNLFCYTGAATVHAVHGKAASSLSVDMSNTYVNWAQRNLILNNVSSEKHEFLRADALLFLQEYRGEKFDVIFVDPPSFSNSKRMQDSFDVQRDHESLIQNCLKIMNPAGTVIFSNNLRTFKMSDNILNKFKVTNITKQTLSEDFRNQKIHNTWRIQF